MDNLPNTQEDLFDANMAGVSARFTPLTPVYTTTQMDGVNQQLIPLKENLVSVKKKFEKTVGTNLDILSQDVTTINSKVDEMAEEIGRVLAAASSKLEQNGGKSHFIVLLNVYCDRIISHVYIVSSYHVTSTFLKKLMPTCLNFGVISNSSLVGKFMLSLETLHFNAQL
jgi:hypothetical protein